MASPLSPKHPITPSSPLLLFLIDPLPVQFCRRAAALPGLTAVCAWARDPLGFPDDASGKEPACQCRRLERRGFDSWVRKVPWRRKWQPAPVFLPGKSPGQRNLVSYSPWGHRELDATEHTRDPSFAPAWFTHYCRTVCIRYRLLRWPVFVVPAVPDFEWPLFLTMSLFVTDNLLN